MGDVKKSYIKSYKPKVGNVTKLSQYIAERTIAKSKPGAKKTHKRF